jgi:transposase-like protein
MRDEDEERHCGNKPNLAKREKVIDLYDSGMTMRAVAVVMGVSHQAIHRMLWRAGHPRRMRGGNTGSHSRHAKK